MSSRPASFPGESLLRELTAASELVDNAADRWPDMAAERLPLGIHVPEWLVQEDPFGHAAQAIRAMRAEPVASNEGKAKWRFWFNIIVVLKSIRVLAEHDLPRAEEVIGNVRGVIGEVMRSRPAHMQIMQFVMSLYFPSMSAAIRTARAWHARPLVSWDYTETDPEPDQVKPFLRCSLGFAHPEPGEIALHLLASSWQSVASRPLFSDRHQHLYTDEPGRTILELRLLSGVRPRCEQLQLVARSGQFEIGPTDWHKREDRCIRSADTRYRQESIDGLLSMLEHRLEGVRALAARAAKSVHDDRVMVALVRMVTSDPSVRVRAEAMHAIATAAERNEFLDDLVGQVLSDQQRELLEVMLIDSAISKSRAVVSAAPRLLEHSAPAVRAEALWVLGGSRRDTSAALAAARERVHDRSRWVRATALAVLSNLDDLEHFSSVWRAVRRDPAIRVLTLLRLRIRAKRTASLQAVIRHCIRGTTPPETYAACALAAHHFGYNQAARSAIDAAGHISELAGQGLRCALSDHSRVMRRSDCIVPKALARRAQSSRVSWVRAAGVKTLVRRRSFSRQDAVRWLGDRESVVRTAFGESIGSRTSDPISCAARDKLLGDVDPYVANAVSLKLSSSVLEDVQVALAKAIRSHGSGCLLGMHSALERCAECDVRMLPETRAMLIAAAMTITRWGHRSVSMWLDQEDDRFSAAGYTPWRALRKEFHCLCDWGEALGAAILQRDVRIGVSKTGLGFTRLAGPQDDHVAMWVSPLPLASDEAHGADMIRGLILHELGHHCWDFGQPGHDAAWSEALRCRVKPIFALLIDERLERHMRSRAHLDPQHNDWCACFDRLARYAFTRSTFQVPLALLSAATGVRPSTLFREVRAGTFPGSMVRTPLQESPSVRLSVQDFIRIPRLAPPALAFTLCLRTGLHPDRSEQQEVAEAMAAVPEHLRTATHKEVLSAARTIAGLVGHDTSPRSLYKRLRQLAAGGRSVSVGFDSDSRSRTVVDPQEDGTGWTLLAPQDGEAFSRAARCTDRYEHPRWSSSASRTAAPAPSSTPTAMEHTRKPNVSRRFARDNLRRRREHLVSIRGHVHDLRRRLALLGMDARPDERSIRGRRLDLGSIQHLAVVPRPDVLVNSRMSVVRPIDLTVLIDRSGSMHGDGIYKARSFAMLIAEAAKGLAHITGCVMAFDNGALYPLGVFRRHSIAALEAGGGNNDAMALHAATMHSHGSVPAARRAVVMISDGMPTACSTEDLDAAIVNAEQRGVVCVQVAVARIPRHRFPHTVDLSSLDLDVAAAQFAEVMGNLLSTMSDSLTMSPLRSKDTRYC